MLRASSPLVLSSTWANKPSSAAASGLYLFTDVGSSGTLMRYAGRWRPLAGQAQLASLGAAVSGITNSGAIPLQTLIPAGAWQSGDTVRVWIAVSKSGATDTGTMNIRIGTAGTSADTVINGLSTTLMSAANRVYASFFDIKLISATSAQKVGSSGVGTYSGAISAAQVAATTITDASANALYVSVELASSGTTDTITLNSGAIQLITP